MANRPLTPRKASLVLLIVGAACLAQYVSKRPPSAASLIDVTGKVHEVIHVSEREASASGAAGGSPSFSPFSAHDWIELDVDLDEDGTKVRQWRFDITGSNLALMDSRKMGSLRGHTVAARVVSNDNYARGYDLKTDNGEIISTYEDIADFQNRGAMVFLAGGVVALLLGAALWFAGRPKQP